LDLITLAGGIPALDWPLWLIVFLMWGLSLRTIYRNKKLLELANEIEYCTGCGNPKNDTIVAAHSNQLRDGKGKGIRASDYRIAYLCAQCHYDIDQGNKLSKDDRRSAWEEAHRKTISWLFESGHIKIL